MTALVTVCGAAALRLSVEASQTGVCVRACVSGANRVSSCAGALPKSVKEAAPAHTCSVRVCLLFGPEWHTHTSCHDGCGSLLLIGVAQSTVPHSCVCVSVCVWSFLWLSAESAATVL